MPKKSKVMALLSSAPPLKTLSIPEAGYKYFGLSKNGSYDAAERGEIPYLQVGRLKRVPIAAMEKMMLEARVHPANPPPLEAPAPAPATAQATRYPPSAAMRRKPRTPALAEG